MTVSSSDSRRTYSGNGSTTAFGVPFYFLASSHLEVVLQAADGTESTQELTTHYTVTGAGNEAGGTVTMLTAPATGETLIIQRNVPATQTSDFPPNDRLPAATVEDALDKLTMLVQQIAGGYGIERVLRLFDGDADGSGRYNANGNTIAGLPSAENEDEAVTLGQAEELFASLSSTGSGVVPLEYDGVGDGATLTFTLGLASVWSAGSGLFYDVFVNGLRKRLTDDYSIGSSGSNRTITFVSAPAVSAVIYVVLRGYAIGEDSGAVQLRADLADANTEGSGNALVAWSVSPQEVAAAVTPSVPRWLYGYVERFGGDPDAADNTQAFADAVAASAVVVIREGTWNIDTMDIDVTGRVILCAGGATVIQQRTGNVGTPVVQGRANNVHLWPTGGPTIIGNISTDTGEHNHAVMIYKAGASLENVSVGDFYAQDCRGDGLYIGSPSGQYVTGVRFGRVTVNNVIRNGLSIVGGRVVRGDQVIADGPVGLCIADVEPDNDPSTDIYIGMVKGRFVQVAPPNAADAAERVHFGMLDLDPAHSADSTPGYSGHISTYGLSLRNVRNVRIDHLKMRDFTHYGIFHTYSPGELAGQRLSIGHLDVANIGSGESTYNSPIVVSNMEAISIESAVVSLQAVGDYLIYGDPVANALRVTIGEISIDGTIARFISNSKILGVKVNTSNVANLIRDVSDTIVQGQITIPNLVNNGTRVSFLNSKLSISGTVKGGTCVDISFPNSLINGYQAPVSVRRMTSTERDAIASGYLEDGLLIYNTTTNKLQCRVSAAWVDMH